MEYKKNDEITLKIDDLGNDGEGIGHVDGYALFVKEALPGETIRARIMKCKKNYGFARMLEILDEGASDEKSTSLNESSAVGRVTPRCPVARQCGGCSLQHLSYEKQLAYKEKKVRDCLERLGDVQFGDKENETKFLPILGMDLDQPWNYRNKAQFPVRMAKDTTGTLRRATGFYAGRSHNIIPVTDCSIQHESMKPILQAILAWMDEYDIPAYDEQKQKGLVRHIYIRRGYHTNQIMVCLVINANGLDERPTKGLIQTLTAIDGMTSICLNINRENTNVILGKRMKYLYGPEYIEDSIGDIKYHISPQSFYQVNPVQTEKLYQTALDFANLSGDEMVWDLYCGIGTISLFLAKAAKHVYGVEIVPEAIENAKANARLNGITNADFYCGAAEEVVPRLVKGELGEGKLKSDVIVVDPPRKGCDAVLLDTIVKMKPKKIVYVSCDPATLARDVKVLRENGYEAKKVQACDMFPMGGHVETVCLLSRKA